MHLCQQADTIHMKPQRPINGVEEEPETDRHRKDRGGNINRHFNNDVQSNLSIRQQGGCGAITSKWWGDRKLTHENR